MNAHVKDNRQTVLWCGRRTDWGDKKRMRSLTPRWDLQINTLVSRLDLHKGPCSDLRLNSSAFRVKPWFVPRSSRLDRTTSSSSVWTALPVPVTWPLASFSFFVQTLICLYAAINLPPPVFMISSHQSLTGLIPPCSLSLSHPSIQLLISQPICCSTYMWLFRTMWTTLERNTRLI